MPIWLPKHALPTSWFRSAFEMPKVKQSSIRNRRYQSSLRAEQLRQARSKRKVSTDKANDASEQLLSVASRLEPTPSSSSCSDAAIPSTSSASSPLNFATLRSEEYQISNPRSDSDDSFDGDASDVSDSESDDQLSDSDGMPSETQNPELPTTICDLREVGDLFAICACPGCGHTALQLTSDEGKSKGLAICLQLTCSNCHEVVGKRYTSARMPNENCFEINRRSVVASIMCGFGSKKFNKLCEALNIPGLNHKTFHKHCDSLYAMTPEIKKHILQLAVQAVRYEHQQLDQALGNEEVYNISVSYDGSWLTRGHSSQIGVSCVIDLLTGLCVDFHVMSKYCQTCETTGKKMEAVGPVAYQVWYQDHMSECQKNFDGTSGMMEVEGAKVIWLRSTDEKLRYTTILSDGDCKTYNELCKLQPYGPDCPIVKEECINHVAKRLGTALRNIVSDCSKRGITLGGRGEGRLTQTAITKLQAYYTKAVRSHTDNVVDMQNAIWASWFHCISTDAEPHHRRCPQGRESWCFFNRAVAQGLPPPPHKDHLGTHLNREVAEHVLPVYKKLADLELLKRCQQGKTQNRNECLHNMIWSRCPKNQFASRSKVEVAVLLAVGEFNEGSSGSQTYLSAQGLHVGNNTVRLGVTRDNVRRSNSQRVKDLKNKQRREKIRLAKQKERRRQEQAEGGPAYIAGGF